MTGKRVGSVKPSKPTQLSNPPKYTAGVFRAYLARQKKEAARLGANEREFLVNALLCFPFRRRSLFESASLERVFRDAPMEQVVLQLRLEFCEWIADSIWQLTGEPRRKQIEARIRGGQQVAAKRRRQAVEKHLKVLEQERVCLEAGTQPHTINKLIARATGYPVGFVRQARKKKLTSG